jgi:hypothetical protein
VIASFGADIVEMESDEPVSEGGEVGFVIEASGEVFDAGVAGIVPVSDRKVGGETIKEGLESVVERELENSLAVFGSEEETVASGRRTEAQVGVMHPAERGPGRAAELSERFFHGRGIGRWRGIGGGEVGFEDGFRGTEKKMQARWVHAPGVHHDVGRSDTGGELEGALGMQEPEGSLLFFPRGRLEEIGCGVADRSRERAEIVNRGNFDPSLLDRAEDTRSEFEPDPVAEFGVEKSQFADLAQHIITVGVTMGAPAGRERKTVGDFGHGRRNARGERSTMERDAQVTGRVRGSGRNRVWKGNLFSSAWISCGLCHH